MAIKARDHKAVASLKEKLKATTNLTPGLELYVNAFLVLDTERNDELAPIPWSSIVAYCREYGLTQRQTDDMVEFIFAADNAVRRDRAKENRDAARRSGRGE